MHTYTHTHIHTYTHTYTPYPGNMQRSSAKTMHTYTYLYIYIYIHTHIHTYIHTYTHTYTPYPGNMQRSSAKTMHTNEIFVNPDVVKGTNYGHPRKLDFNSEQNVSESESKQNVSESESKENASTNKVFRNTQTQNQNTLFTTDSTQNANFTLYTSAAEDITSEDCNNNFHTFPRKIAASNENSNPNAAEEHNRRKIITNKNKPQEIASHTANRDMLFHASSRYANFGAHKYKDPDAITSVLFGNSLSSVDNTESTFGQITITDDTTTGSVETDTSTLRDNNCTMGVHNNTNYSNQNNSSIKDRSHLVSKLLGQTYSHNNSSSSFSGPHLFCEERTNSSSSLLLDGYVDLSVEDLIGSHDDDDRAGVRYLL
jgi:hypothetical protein